MEAVGARLGRSSTRYGPATVFTGPVRRWKKRWVHSSPLTSSNNHTSYNNHHSQASTNGAVYDANGARLLFYKWSPNSQIKDDAEDDDELSRRKFKYIPVALLEEEKNEAAEMVELEDEAEPDDSSLATPPTFKTDRNDDELDINGMPMEETQASDSEIERQDLNETTLDLSLG